jgi:hypothetical protein
MKLPEKVRYKDRHLDRMYWLMLDLARDPKSELYLYGAQHRGAYHRCAFWDGYNGLDPSAHKGAPGTMARACYMAGKAFRKEKEKDPYLSGVKR